MVGLGMAWPNALDIDFSKHFPQHRPKPVMVVVHDAFHTSEHFDLLRAELVKAEWRVLAPQLPSSSFAYRPHSFEADVRSIFDCAAPALLAGNDIMIVAHGYGAVPGSIAAEQLNIISLDRPRSGMVKNLVFIGGIVTQPNESYSDIVSINDNANEVGMIAAERPLQTFFNDCPSEVANRAAMSLRMQSLESLHTKVQSPGWAKIPCVYIVCEFDPLFLQACQYACVARMRKLNGNVTIRRVLAGHAPHISQPREIAEILGQVSG